jgi:hypothetical protein
MLVKDAIEHLKRYYKEDETVCMLLWSTDDVVHHAQDLDIDVPESDEVAGVLDAMEYNHDVAIGVTWDTVDHYLTDL